VGILPKETSPPTFLPRTIAYLFSPSDRHQAGFDLPGINMKGEGNRFDGTSFKKREELH
jgi:hypothetical protein